MSEYARADGLPSMPAHEDDDLNVMRQDKADKSAVQEGRGGLSDAHLADKVAAEVFEGRYCWAVGLGWLMWDGKRWANVPEAAPLDAVRRFFIQWHGRQARKPEPDVSLLRALSGLLSRAKIESVVKLTKGIVMVDAGDFDQRPDLLNVNNGVVDLTTGELWPHDPDLLLTKLSPVDYIPGATHPDWDKALEALPADVAPWMQERFGQAATGYPTPDDKLPVCKGGGSNGKSTVFAAISRALGEHAVAVPERVLLTSGSAHPTEMMVLRGARLALIEETPEARHLNVKRLKDVLGTPTMTARLVHKDTVEWAATHSLFLASNYAPRVDETDHGTWRRLALVQFPYTFVAPGAPLKSASERHGVEGLRDRLRDGLEGQHEAVLAWLVEGARRWYAHGRVLPQPPQTVAADTAEWRAEADLVFAYSAERLVTERDWHVMASELLEDLNKWLEERGHKRWASQTMSDRFKDHERIGGQGAHPGKRRLTQGDGSTLSRPRWASLIDSPPSQYRVWFGVRFRIEADDLEPSDVPVSSVGTDGTEEIKPSYVVSHMGEFQNVCPTRPTVTADAFLTTGDYCGICREYSAGGALHGACRSLSRGGAA